MCGSGNECYGEWVLKNSLFIPNSQNWGDRKCLGDPTKSIVGHPDAFLFLRISRKGVFQQPRLITTVTPYIYLNADAKNPCVRLLASTTVPVTIPKSLILE